MPASLQLMPEANKWGMMLILDKEEVGNAT